MRGTRNTQGAARLFFTLAVIHAIAGMVLFAYISVKEIWKA